MKKELNKLIEFYKVLAAVALMAIESLACGLYVVTTEIEALKSLLGKEIEESGIIKYVPLPEIYDTDKPVQEDLPEFKENLTQAILSQIEKVRDKQELCEELKDKIKCFSWDRLVDDMNNIIKEEGIWA